MADEFETKPEAEQDKREQAKRDLADLQKLMAEVQGSSVDSGEKPEPKKREAVSVDELIDRAASDAESDTEPEETEQAEQKTKAPSQIDESQSKDAEKQKQEKAKELETEKEETLEERRQEEREQAQREAVLNQQKRRREAAQAAAGTPIEQKKTEKKSRIRAQDWRGNVTDSWFAWAPCWLSRWWRWYSLYPRYAVSLAVAARRTIPQRVRKQRHPL